MSDMYTDLLQVNCFEVHQQIAKQNMSVCFDVMDASPKRMLSAD